MMQAFLWRFLVPQQELAVAITGERAVPAVWRPLVPGMKLTSQAALRLDPGDMAQVQVEAPKVLPDSRKSALESVRFRISSQPRGIGDTSGSHRGRPHAQGRQEHDAAR
jgi:hypothetical protein